MADFGDPLPQDPLDAPAPASNELARPTETAIVHSLPTGTGLGKYKILERIRTYHNAVVYKARDTMLDRLVALKQMAPDLMDNPTACGNFKKEAQLLARVPKDARYVLNVHELIEDEKGLFIVEEYIHGDWLESLIAKRRVGIADTYKLLKSAMIGLRDIHAQKIVHRDINPGNLMILKGAAKLANFYSAAQEGDTVSPPVITVKYSAPELLLEKNYDDRIDIYSLGMVLYEVSVGRVAFERCFESIIGSRLPISAWFKWQVDPTQRLPDPELLNPAVPVPLSNILRQMTAKRLEERFTCAEEVLAAISRHTRRPSPAKLPARDWQPVEDRASTPSEPRPARILPAPRVAPAPSTPPAFHTPFKTVTQNVRTAAWRATDFGDTATHVPYERVSPFRAPRAESPKQRIVAPAAMPRAMPAPIMPRSPRKPNRHKQHPVLITCAASFLLIACGVGGYFTWDFILRQSSKNPIEATIAQAETALEANDAAGARRFFEQAAQTVESSADLQRYRPEMQHWLQLMDAVDALNKDDFSRAQRLLRDLEKYGDINPSRLNDLQKKIWNKQDAYKIAAAGYDGIKLGNFENVKQSLDQYERVAKDAGLDPSALKDKLTAEKARKEYQDWIKTAEEALKLKEFDKAFTALSRAEDFVITSDSRDLRKRITDAQRQSEYMIQGEKAMIAGEFAEALKAYEEANFRLASPEIEKKVREARAHVLLNEAREAIDRGELLLGEDKLNSSIWNHPLFDAQTKLEKMRPAFDAARIARNGDRAVDIEDFKEAIRFYEEAILRLPKPADQLVAKKLNEARRREAIVRGETAMKREDWKSAIDALTEAQKLSFDTAVEELLIKCKAKLP